uniref:Chromo domain-containing protein n=1 Tax=Strongyloides papillosus TaxID=174720 RepID=A0A0N5BBS6_STREA
MSSRKKAKVSSEDDSTDDEYVVEDILGRKVKRGKTYYKIKWEGYPISKCTWEPRHHLSKSLIKRYEKSISNGTPFSETHSGDSDSDEGKNSKTPSLEPKIEKILEKIEKKNQIKYKVQYDNQRTKWVDLEDIKDESIINDFEDKILNFGNFNSNKKRQRNSPGSGNGNQNEVKKKNLDFSFSFESQFTPKSPNKTSTSNETDPEKRRSGSYYTPDENNIIDENPMMKPKSARAINCSYGSEENSIGLVEKILCHRIANWKKEYKVRWKGFSPEHDSWQTAETFMDKWIIDEYENRLPRLDSYLEINEGHRSVVSSSDEEDILLVKLMKKVKRGKKRKEKDINGILGVHFDKNQEKVYVVQLKSKKVILMYGEDIPAKFRNECFRVSCGRIFE